MNTPEIIVAVDGSPAARAAVTWAAAEAVRRHAELVVVHAYDWRVVGAKAPVAGGWADSVHAQAEELVADAVAAAKESAPDVKVRGEALLGQAGPTLIAAARSGALIVVGNRGRGGFASMLLGSVSQQVATHADASVVVVRGRPDATSGPIVVGTDGSDTARAAVDVAFEEAEARGTRVVAIRAYADATAPWGPESAPYVDRWDDRRDEEKQILEDEIAPWRVRFPTVAVETLVFDGNPVRVLVDMSSTAQLVVVGTRGHGGFAGLLLGSVGLQLLHHADCPVIIVRSEATPAA